MSPFRVLGNLIGLVLMLSYKKLKRPVENQRTVDGGLED
jgi:hypothetical protein